MIGKSIDPGIHGRIHAGSLLLASLFCFTTLALAEENAFLTLAHPGTYVVGGFDTSQELPEHCVSRDWLAAALLMDAYPNALTRFAGACEANGFAAASSDPAIETLAAKSAIRYLVERNKRRKYFANADTDEKKAQALIKLVKDLGGEIATVVKERPQRLALQIPGNASPQDWQKGSDVLWKKRRILFKSENGESVFSEFGNLPPNVAAVLNEADNDRPPVIAVIIEVRTVKPLEKGVEVTARPACDDGANCWVAWNRDGSTALEGDARIAAGRANALKLKEELGVVLVDGGVAFWGPNSGIITENSRSYSSPTLIVELLAFKRDPDLILSSVTENFVTHFGIRTKGGGYGPDDAFYGRSGWHGRDKFEKEDSKEAYTAALKDRLNRAVKHLKLPLAVSLVIGVHMNIDTYDENTGRMDLRYSTWMIQRERPSGRRQAGVRIADLVPQNSLPSISGKSPFGHLKVVGDKILLGQSTKMTEQEARDFVAILRRPGAHVAVIRGVLSEGNEPLAWAEKLTIEGNMGLELQIGSASVYKARDVGLPVLVTYPVQRVMDIPLAEAPLE